MRTAPTLTACLLALFAVAAATSGAAATTAATDGATVGVSDGQVATGETTTASVALSAVPDGLSGYNVTVRVADPDRATIVAASVPARFGLSEARVVGGGDAAVLKAVDTNEKVGAGETDVGLGTVTLRGETAGETSLRVEITQIDDDDGGRMTPETTAGSLVVGEATDRPTTTTQATTATGTTETATADDPTATDTSTDDGPPPSETATPGDGSTPGLGSAAAVVAILVTLGALALARRDDGRG
jgi:hypothetical protein